MKIFIYAALFLLIINTTSYAQKIDNDSYASILDVPYPFTDLPRNYEYPEQYLFEMTYVIRQYGRNKTYLDREDLNKLRRKIRDDARRSILQSLIHYDRNFDGQATRDEIKQYFLNTVSYKKNYDPADLESEISRAMLADNNQDNVVLRKEIIDYSDKAKERHDDSDLLKAESLLAQDIDKDGRITVDETEILARKAFQAIDVDQNGLISDQERKAASEANIKHTNKIIESR